VVLVGVPFVVALSPIGPRRTRFFATYIIILVLLCNVCAALFMSAGPFSFAVNGATLNDYAPLMAYLDHGERDRQFSATLFRPICGRPT
jgi:hypothetical protein